MGKGNRNRNLHQQQTVETPVKKVQPNKKVQAPKWLPSLIAIVVVVGILIGAVAAMIVNSGSILRGRVIVESKTGNYDINQQMATFMIWQSVYSNYYSYYSVYSSSSAQSYYPELYAIAKQAGSADSFALYMASTVQGGLRDYMDSMLEQFKAYVAICDKAEERGITLDDKDMESIENAIDEVKAIKDATRYVTVPFKTFLEDMVAPGMREKDVKNALKIMALYSKYVTVYQTEMETTLAGDTTGILADYRDKNPESFFSSAFLTFNTDSKTFADALKAAGSVERFKEMVIENHVDTNYKGVYNKYTVQADAEADYNSINKKTDADGKTEWTNAVTAVTGWDEKTNWAYDSFTFPDEVKTWLFDEARKQYDTYLATTEDNLYLITVKALSGEATDDDNKTLATIEAYIKAYKLESGESHGEDTAFKSNILTQLKHNKNESITAPETAYKTAKDYATDLEKALEATGADKNALLTEAGATKVTLVEGQETNAPEAVEDAVADVKDGDDQIFTVEDDDVAYLVAVTLSEGKTTEYYYVEYENDLYHKIVNDLTASLDKVYPKEDAADYDSDAKEGSFEAWISETSGEGLNFVRKENDTTVIENKKTDEKTKVETVTYDVYIVAGPMKLDETVTVHGAYYQLTDTDSAETITAALSGKTYYELILELANLGGKHSIEAGITEETLDKDKADTKVKEWLFAADRTANTYEVIDSADGKSKYVVVFVDKMTAWESEAQIGYIQQEFSDMLDELIAGYSVNEKVLKKIGEPTTTAATTTAAASEATSEKVTDAGLNG